MVHSAFFCCSPRVGIAWLILSQIKTCGDPRGTVTVDAPVAQDGEHLVFELRRLPYHEKDDSATRAIPDDADNDEGPSGDTSIALSCCFTPR